jgi:hypothetical protein
MVISIDKEPIFVSGGGFARRAAKPLKERGTKIKFHENKASCWRLIFFAECGEWLRLPWRGSAACEVAMA